MTNVSPPGALSTVLSQMLGVFDHRTLTAAFFPTFVSLSAILAASVLLAEGAEDTVDWFSDKNEFAIGSLAIGFLLVTMFLALVLANLQDAVKRLFQGSWPTILPLSWLQPVLTRRQQRIHLGLRQQYDESREMLAALTRLEEEIRAATKEPPRSTSERPSPNDRTPCPLCTFNGAAEDFSKVVGKLCRRVVSSRDRNRPLPDVCKVQRKLERAEEQLRELQLATGTALTRYTRTSTDDPAEVRSVRHSFDCPHARESCRQDAFAGFTGDDSEGFHRYVIRRISVECRLISDARGKLEKLVEETREYYLFAYPIRDGAVGATTLGNIFGAMDEYPYRAYGIDAATVWVRLQPLLPNSLLNPLQDIKTSLDFLLTNALFTSVVGIPLAVVTAIFIGDFDDSWYPPLAVATGLAAPVFFYALSKDRRRLFRRLGEKKLERTASERILGWATSTLAIVIPLLGAVTILLELGYEPLRKMAAAILLTITLILISYFFYWNSLWCATIFGEKVRTCFDLYRWEVLDRFNVARPHDLETEWRTWRGIRGMMFDDRFDPRHFMFRPRRIAAEGELRHHLVARRALPRGSTVLTKDLASVEVGADLLPEGSLVAASQAANQVTLAPIPAGQPLSANLLCPTSGEAKEFTEVPVHEISDQNLEKWLLLPGDHLTVRQYPARRSVRRPRRRWPEPVEVTVCQVIPYEHEDLRRYSSGHRQIGEAEQLVTVAIKEKKLEQIRRLSGSHETVLTHNIPNGRRLQP